MAATVAVNGLEILLKFAVFMGDFYIGLIPLWACWSSPASCSSGRACSSC
jgi:hypothetical protein